MSKPLILIRVSNCRQAIYRDGVKVLDSNYRHGTDFLIDVLTALGMKVEEDWCRDDNENFPDVLPGKQS